MQTPSQECIWRLRSKLLALMVTYYHEEEAEEEEEEEEEGAEEDIQLVKFHHALSPENI